MASLVILACTLLAGISRSASQSNYQPDTQNVYHLFTRLNPTISQPMLLGWPSLIGSNFSAQRRTVIIIHAFDSGPTSPFNVALVPAVLAAGDVNLIAVDWSAGATQNDSHVLISHNVPIGAESIARFIVWLNQETGATLDQYHIIGFEVGSHIGGLVGRALNGLVPFVTALNPPQQGWNETNMFSSTDGLVTEAIHTNMFGTGPMAPVADMNFYPNGALTQPGCYSFDWECSQDRVFQLFAESIVSGGFTSTKCETYAQILSGGCNGTSTLPMGGLSNKAGNSGLYYLETNAARPYSRG